MKKSGYAVKLDPRILKELKTFCDEKGYKQGSFVEKALREQMQREGLKDDIFELVSLRPLEAVARPFRDYDRSRR